MSLPHRDHAAVITWTHSIHGICLASPSMSRRIPIQRGEKQILRNSHRLVAAPRRLILTILVMLGLGIAGAIIPTPPPHGESVTQATSLDAVRVHSASQLTVAQTLIPPIQNSAWSLRRSAPTIVDGQYLLQHPWRPARLAGANRAAPRPPPA
jgi:hypothetical protein